jgi:hypothetical protein
MFYLLHPRGLVRLLDTFESVYDLLWKIFMKLSERNILYERRFENINVMTGDHFYWNILKILLVFPIVVFLAYFPYFERKI